MLGGVGVGADEAEHLVGAVAAGGPDFLAVDDVVVAVADGAGLERGEVGAAARLGVALAPDVLAGGDLGQVLGLLLVVAVDDQGGADHADAEAAGAGVGRAVVAELLVEDHLLGDRGAEATVLGGPGGGNPAALGELGVEGLGLLEVVGGAFAGAARPGGAIELGDVVEQEAADVAAQLLFGFAESEFHGALPCLRSCVSLAHSGGAAGAGDGTRTRDPLLGKQMLYRLSYSRPLLTDQVYRPQRDGEEAAGDRRGG